MMNPVGMAQPICHAYGILMYTHEMDYYQYVMPKAFGSKYTAYLSLPICHYFTCTSLNDD